MKKNIDKKIINKNNYKSKNNLNEPYDKKTFISIIALPLSLVYILICAILKFKFFKPKQICKKTIGISSFAFNSDVKYICIAIANELKSKGKNVCFVEKQHGKYKKKLVVPYNHYKIFNDFEVSDDVLLFSKYADVLAVKNRKKAKTNNYDIAICNDSFFDFEIKKDCSILVLDDVFFVGNGNAYPSGKLKYKISYIKKANFVIIKQITDNDIYKKIIFLTKFIPLEKILTAKIVINKDYDLTNKYLVFSSIVNNKEFVKVLNDNNFLITKSLFFKPHKHYTKKNLLFIKNQFISSKADKIITTIEDYLKLPQSFKEELNIEFFDFSYKIDGVEKITSAVL